VAACGILVLSLVGTRTRLSGSASIRLAFPSEYTSPARVKSRDYSFISL
jgi:hypothetical protein